MSCIKFIPLLLLIPTLLLADINPYGRAEATYFESKVGCLSPSSFLTKMDCTSHQVEFDILKTLSTSKRANSKQDLLQKIYSRAQYFLDQNKYDYFSVLSLMVFDVPDKEVWLSKFKMVPGERIPYTNIALERVRGKKVPSCDQNRSKKYPLYFDEICNLKVSLVNRTQSRK